jgi:hypothetical protein
MIRNKIAAALAGAALVVAVGATAAGADDGSRDPGTERQNGTIDCNEWGGTVWMDTDGNGVMDTSYPWACFGMIYTIRITV